jgi:hypothetical protein
MGTPDFADAHPGYGLRLRGPKLGRKSRRENVLCWLFRQHLVARMERSEIRERRASAAGRIPEAARERSANPPAGTAPAPSSGLPPEGVPSERDSSAVAEMVTNVNGAKRFVTSAETAQHA